MTENRRVGALSEKEDERVRAEVRRLKGTGSAAELAERLDVSVSTVTRHLKGFPAGLPFTQKVAAATGKSLEELLGRTPPARSEPRLCDLEGWEDAEHIARSRFRFIPEEAWQAVRNLRTGVPPRWLSPEWISSMAADWARVLTGEGDETEKWKTELENVRRRREEKK